MHDTVNNDIKNVVDINDTIKKQFHFYKYLHF